MKPTFDADIPEAALAALCEASGGEDAAQARGSLDASGLRLALWEDTRLVGLLWGLGDGAGVYVRGCLLDASRPAAALEAALIEALEGRHGDARERLWLAPSPPSDRWRAAGFEPRRSPPPAPRWSLAALSGVTGLILGGAAVVLPWGSWTLFAMLTSLVAAAHGVTAALAALGHRARGMSWRVQSMLSLAYLGYITWGVVQSAVYLSALYGGLGAGVAAAMGALWANVVLLTVPLSVWGLAATGGLGRGRRGWLIGSALLASLALGGLAWTDHDARPVALVEDTEAVREALTRSLPEWRALPPLYRPREAPTLYSRDPVRCAASVSPERVTVVVSYLTRSKRPERRVRCLQAETLDAALGPLATHLREEAARSSIKIDVLRGVHALEEWPGLIEALSLRPGLDGVCDGARCLMPWQLVGMDAFRSFRPLKDVPDLSFGVDAPTLRRWLGAAPASTLAGLSRVTTHSFVVGPSGQLHRLRRLRPVDTILSAEVLDVANARSRRYIEQAQDPKSGRFRYLLQPFTGEESSHGFSAARHAGTTMMLCELSGETPPRVVIQRAVRALAALEQRRGERTMLFNPANQRGEIIRLNGNALGLAALIACRPVAGEAQDGLIARAARTLLDAQREDGGFYTLVERDTAAAIESPDRLYVPGQTMLALVLLEGLLAEEVSLPGVDREEVHAAVERAMDYFATDYWPGFLRGFFFLEENWHCIAARAALPHHRHDGFERFCMDYSDFKRRLILEEDSDVDFDLIGGHGFGNLIVPQNTPTAGIGETLAAAMAVKQARGMDLARDRALMRDILQYLVAQQWVPTNCFACARTPQALGGVGEHAATTVVRIDFVQHFWAAAQYGGAFLFD